MHSTTGKEEQAPSGPAEAEGPQEQEESLLGTAVNIAKQAVNSSKASAAAGLSALEQSTGRMLPAEKVCVYVCMV